MCKAFSKVCCQDKKFNWTSNTVDNNYMKLFDGKPNAIKTLSSVLLPPTLMFVTFWRHLHIQFCHHDVSDHKNKLCLIFRICRKLEQMPLSINSSSWKFATGTVITFLCIQMDHNKDMIETNFVFFFITTWCKKNCQCYLNFYLSTTIDEVATKRLQNPSCNFTHLNSESYKRKGKQ